MKLPQNVVPMPAEQRAELKRLATVLAGHHYGASDPYWRRYRAIATPANALATLSRLEALEAEVQRQTERASIADADNAQLSAEIAGATTRATTAETAAAQLRGELAEQEVAKLELTKELKQGGLNPFLPADNWGDDDGCVLWWTFPICEPPCVGSPLDCEWDYNNTYTHYQKIDERGYDHDRAVREFGENASRPVPQEVEAAAGPGEMSRPEKLAKVSDQTLLDFAAEVEPGSDAHYDAIMEICNRGLKDPEAGDIACNYLPDLKANMQTRPRIRLGAALPLGSKPEGGAGG